ncbi:MAG: hypothetical protein K0Q94_4011, partial [Paenibacillus sp.]|nr:hypothetical protein [Paenibacillus sp.]
ACACSDTAAGAGAAYSPVALACCSDAADSPGAVACCRDCSDPWGVGMCWDDSSDFLGADTCCFISPLLSRFSSREINLPIHMTGCVGQRGSPTIQSTTIAAITIQAVSCHENSSTFIPPVPRIAPTSALDKQPSNHSVSLPVRSANTSIRHAISPSIRRLRSTRLSVRLSYYRGVRLSSVGRLSVVCPPGSIHCIEVLAGRSK